MNMKRHFTTLLLLIVGILILTGCKDKPVSQYKAKYREAELVGEWVRYHSSIVEGNTTYGPKKEVVLMDTFVFSYNNIVFYKRRDTYNHNYAPDNKWGTYEMVKGTYYMINDTLTVALDYPNIYRENFGTDPENILGIGPIYIFQNDTIRSQYSVKKLTTDYIELNCLKRWSKEFTQDYTGKAPDTISYYRR
jgi:hypothetical protein